MQVSVRSQGKNGHMPTVATELACSDCLMQAKTSRLPGGWKRHGEEIFCKTCWRKRYVLRAICIPVVSPVEGSWTELRAALKEMWSATTSASNWIATQCLVRDVVRPPGGDARMPALVRPYLYPELRQHFPGLPPQSVVSLERVVSARYRAQRYEIVWTGRRSLPSYRYPQPFPVHNQSWAPTIRAENPIVTVRIGDRKWALRLKGGPRYRRQLAAYSSMVSGEAVYGEMALYEAGDHLMCKMVAWLPRQAPRDLSGTLYVHTSPDSLLIALNDKGEHVWRYHADQSRRWTAEHRRQLQRWADDTKAEQRFIPGFQARRTQATEKYHRRMQTLCQQVAASTVGYAVRRKFKVIEYDDGERSYCPEFPWATLRDRLAELADGHGLEWDPNVHAKSGTQESPAMVTEKSI